jgi:hypothetical protein
MFLQANDMLRAVHEPNVGEGSFGPFSVYGSGNVGQEIRDPDGKTVAWTTDPWLARVIATLLSQNEHLLAINEGG